MKSVCYRQGDVFLILVNQLPSAQLRRSHNAVLAEGEMTGHAHRLLEPTHGEVFTADGQMYLNVIEDQATIVHDEHHPVAVPRGAYAVRIQREYTPKGIQRVYD
jgi:hypothetical protein